MPFIIPTFRRTRELVRDEVTAALSGAVLIGNNVLRVMSDTTAAMCHLTLRHGAWIALQLMVDTAEDEWLDRHGDIWLTNADGSTGRKGASYAEGTASFTGTVGTVVSQFTPLTAGNVGFETTEEIVIGSTATLAHIRALDPGTVGNLEPGINLGFSEIPPAGLETTITVVELAGGVDEEISSDLRYRVLQRIQQPPMGGAAHDYVRWALDVDGVTRAWVEPNGMGIGTVIVRFMMDVLRAENDGFPTPYDCRVVEAFLDTVRPVAVKDRFVVAPVKQYINFVLTQLTPDNSTVRAAIRASALDMLDERAAPGQTIYSAWKSDAVLNAAGVISFQLDPADDVMESPGHMAVLGDIYYA